MGVHLLILGIQKVRVLCEVGFVQLLHPHIYRRVHEERAGYRE